MKKLEVTQLEFKRYHTKAKYLKFSTVPYKEKTMAADLLARELGLLVYGVKLNQVMSKFIGETEKNMVRVLKAAEMKKTVVLLNEADALF
jgi:SpoVK/Ycf46/Vps4 family AAA+-type ATPase